MCTCMEINKEKNECTCSIWDFLYSILGNMITYIEHIMNVILQWKHTQCSGTNLYTTDIHGCKVHKCAHTHTHTFTHTHTHSYTHAHTHTHSHTHTHVHTHTRTDTHLLMHTRKTSKKQNDREIRLIMHQSTGFSELNSELSLLTR